MGALAGREGMTGDRGVKALERLTFFSDAVFAIAMTLLVIEIRVPHVEAATDGALVEALAGLVPNYIGFLVSFAVVARFWIGHHRVMGMVAEARPALVRANLLLLLTIAFMPFPTAVLSDYAQLRAAAIFYAGWLVVTGIANLLTVQAALGRPELLQPGVAQAEVDAVLRTRWLPIAVGGLAMLAATIAPLWAIAAMIVATPLLDALLWRLPGRG